MSTTFLTSSSFASTSRDQTINAEEAVHLHFPTGTVPCSLLNDPHRPSYIPYFLAGIGRVVEQQTRRDFRHYFRLPQRTYRTATPSQNLGAPIALASPSALPASKGFRWDMVSCLRKKLYRLLGAPTAADTVHLEDDRFLSDTSTELSESDRTTTYASTHSSPPRSEAAYETHVIASLKSSIAQVEEDIRKLNRILHLHRLMKDLNSVKQELTVVLLHLRRGSVSNRGFDYQNLRHSSLRHAISCPDLTAC